MSTTVIRLCMIGAASAALAACSQPSSSSAPASSTYIPPLSGAPAASSTPPVASTAPSSLSVNPPSSSPGAPQPNAGDVQAARQGQAPAGPVNPSHYRYRHRHDSTDGERG